MKYKILFQLSFILALAFISSSYVNASEVTGNLSSSGILSSQNTIASGTISGTVVSGSTSGGFGGGTTSGTVPGRGGGGSLILKSQNNLAVSNQSGSLSSGNGTAPLVPSSTPAFGDFGSANQTSSGLAAGRGIAKAGTDLDTLAQNFAPALVLDSNPNISIGSWIWIILLILLLIVTVLYIYNRNNRNKIRNV